MEAGCSEVVVAGPGAKPANGPVAAEESSVAIAAAARVERKGRIGRGR